MGATTMAIVTQPIMEAARSRSKTSRMMARLMTRPEEAPKLCSTRARMSDQALGATAAPTLMTKPSASAPMSTGRRP